MGRRLLLALAAAAAAACGSIGAGSGGGDDDVEPPDAATTPTADATAGLGPFSEPHLLDTLSMTGANDDDPTVTGDQLELIFNSDRSGNSQLYFSRRNSVDEPWGDPQLVPGVNSADSETAPELSTDGLTLYFSSNRAGGKGKHDIYITHRDNRDAAWDPPDLVPELNSASNDYSPVEEDSGLVVYFYSTRDGGDQDLFKATRPSKDDLWHTPPALVDELDTADNDADPFVTGDGLTLYFGSGSSGVLDIYVAGRLDRDAAFDPAAPVDELNSDGQDTDPWVSPDGRTMVLTSNRAGDNDLYEATR
jgi:Tol biopolymer transport system component